MASRRSKSSADKKAADSDSILDAPKANFDEIGTAASSLPLSSPKAKIQASEAPHAADEVLDPSTAHPKKSLSGSGVSDGVSGQNNGGMPASPAAIRSGAEADDADAASESGKSSSKKRHSRSKIHSSLKLNAEPMYSLDGDSLDGGGKTQPSSSGRSAAAASASGSSGEGTESSSSFTTNSASADHIEVSDSASPSETVRHRPKNRKKKGIARSTSHVKSEEKADPSICRSSGDSAGKGPASENAFDKDVPRDEAPDERHQSLRGDKSGEHSEKNEPPSQPFFREKEGKAETGNNPGVSSAAGTARLRHILQRTGKAERIRSLIIIDVSALIRRLSAQLPSMIELFSRHRDRETLLAPLRSWIPTAAFEHLAELEPLEQRVLSEFLEELEALRWYCRYTNDMPNTAQTRLQRFAEQLDNAAQKLIQELQANMTPETARKL